MTLLMSGCISPSITQQAAGWLKRMGLQLLRGAPVLRCSLVVLAACALPLSPALADYRLGSGDIVEVSVAGLPDIHQRAAIQLDGYISMPLLGRVRLQGLTASEMQAKIEAGLSGKQISQRTPDGRERIVVIQYGDVAAWVAEYRPIFVSGNVLTPNQYPYRQKMTVRHAIALSGGYSLPRGILPAVPYDQLDLRRDYRELSIDLTREQVHLRRLEAEIAERTELAPIVDDTHIQHDLEATIEESEQRALKIAIESHVREKGLLTSTIAQTEKQIALLESLERDEKSAGRDEAEERDRVDRLVKKGTVTYPRLMETRRAALQQTNNWTRIRLDLARARQQHDEVQSRLERLDTQRALSLLQDTASSKARIAAIFARISNVVEKMQLTGHSPVANSPVHPNVSIVRTVDNKQVRIAADEDTELLPGDVVDVGQRNDLYAVLRGGISDKQDLTTSSIPSPGQ